jgi:lipoprotein-anchoring transpeptidase ErfK/SrfK
MQRLILPVIVTAFTFTTATAGPLNLNPHNLSSPGGAPSAAGSPADGALVPRVQSPSPNLGGGFLELLFRGPGNSDAPRYESRLPFQRQMEPVEQDPSGRQYTLDPRYQKQVVNYDGRERGGTIIINTNERLLYLVQDDGTAIRYGIGVGRPGFTWAGVRQVTRKREWPDWTPPPEMLKRRPDLPRHMEGGPENPLGARAMYLGSTLYRIHGSNEPWTIGTAVSSGCIRMRNEDVIDLYERVRLGTRVVVI